METSQGTTSGAGAAGGADPAGGPTPVRFGLVGAGFIARWFMEAAQTLPQVLPVAVTSAHAERARAFAREHGLAAAYPSLEEMLRAGAPDGPTPVDVVYIGSPNAVHAEQALEALEAGFHVLVEKPFALHAEDARRMVAAARANDRFLMEAWMPAFEPGITAARRAVAERADRGDPPHRAVLVKEQYSSRMDRYRAGELPPALDPAMGGGSLMDLGVYPVSLAIHLFGEPASVRASGRLLASGADSHGAVVLEYDRTPDGAPADLEVVCLHSKTSSGAIESQVAWDREVLTLDDCQRPSRVRLHDTGRAGGCGPRELLEPSPAAPVLARELAEVCRLVAAGARQSELHPWAATVAGVSVLEAARAQIGLRLPGDGEPSARMAP